MLSGVVVHLQCCGSWQEWDFDAHPSIVPLTVHVMYVMVGWLDSFKMNLN